jgi:hypothetical protein
MSCVFAAVINCISLVKINMLLNCVCSGFLHSPSPVFFLGQAVSQVPSVARLLWAAAHVAILARGGRPARGQPTLPPRQYHRARFGHARTNHTRFSRRAGAVAQCASCLELGRICIASLLIVIDLFDYYIHTRVNTCAQNLALYKCCIVLGSYVS